MKKKPDKVKIVQLVYTPDLYYQFSGLGDDGHVYRYSGKYNIWYLYKV